MDRWSYLLIRPRHDTQSGSRVGAIAAVVLGVVVLVGVIAAVLLWRRRRSRRSEVLA